MSEQDEIRLKEIDSELEEIRSLLKEHSSWHDEQTGKTWFPPGRWFNYSKTVEREYELGLERNEILKRMGSA